jgi:hypothetical protein
LSLKDRLIARASDVTPTSQLGASAQGDSLRHESLTASRGQGDSRCLQEELDVIRQKGPGVTSGPRGGQHRPEAVHEILSVRIIPENGLPLDAAADDMVERSGRIQAGPTWHEGLLSHPYEPSNS